MLVFTTKIPVKSTLTEKCLLICVQNGYMEVLTITI